MSVLRCAQLPVSSRWADRREVTNTKTAQNHTQAIRRNQLDHQESQSFPVKMYSQALFKLNSHKKAHNKYNVIIIDIFSQQSGTSPPQQNKHKLI